jgi:heme A synthase
LAFTVLVILWGAYVRATGSGNGCGRNWPTCQGSFVPSVGATKTPMAMVIELTHRATSGLAFLLVVGQLVWALKLFPRGSGGRRAAIAATVFMITEAALGAGLVLFEMVAGNKSIARAWWVSAHLLNTFALLAAQAVTIFYAGAAAGPTRRDRFAFRVAVGLMVGALLVGTSGAIAALGDTLFPVASLAEGFRQDLSPTAHAFVRLRVWHPVLACTLGVTALLLTGAIASRSRGRLRSLATATAGVVLVQLALGFANLALRAPVAMQLVHLLVADAVWLHFVLLASRAAHVPDDGAAAVTAVAAPAV